MKHGGIDFFRDPLIRWAIIAISTLHLADWIVLAWFVRPVDYHIILHYNVYFGVALIGNWQEAYAIAFLGFLILLLNTALALRLYTRLERTAAHLLLLAAFMVQVGTLVASIGIIIVNYF